jgi:MFS family permease
VALRSLQDYEEGAIAAVGSHPTPSARRRILVAGTIGTAIEWYDFFIYGLIAPLVFDQLFFPKFDPLTATLAVFATFAVGFFARPLGGIIFGHFGDRIGRKSVLLWTLLLMGLATMSVGLLPTYGRAGAIATVALVVLRFIQGFAIQAAGPLGVVLASFAALVISRLPEADLLSWGWRVPFLISAILVALGLYMRLRIEESAVFRAASAVAAVPAVEALRTHWRSIVIVFFAEMAQTSYFYLTAIFTIAFATRQLGVPKDVITQAVLLANLVGLVAMPLIGAWSDRIGRKRLFLAGVVIAAASMFAFYQVVASRDTLLVTLAVTLAAGVIHPLMFSTEGSYFPELFPTRIRFTGVSIGKQFGVVFGGGIAPLVATSLYAQTGTTYAITGYYVVLALAAVIALGFARETSKSRLLG